MDRRSNRVSVAMISSLAVAALASACQSSSTEVAAEAEAEATVETMAMVSAADQAATDSITVASVTMESDGFVVVHASNPDGSVIAPDSIGHVAVSSGTHSNVVVPLTQSVAAGSVVHVMLHNDSGEIGVYEFMTGKTDVDVPVAGANLAMVTVQ